MPSSRRPNAGSAPTSSAGGVIRAAQLISGDVRPYRFDFYKRLGQRDDLRLVLYAGRSAPGMGAPEEPPQDLGIPLVPVTNYFLKNSLRVIWQVGAVSMLRSEADVLVCPEVVHNLSIWLIRLLHKRFGKGLVLYGYFYRPGPERPAVRLGRLLRRWLQRSAGSLVTYTDRGKSTLIAQGIEPSRIFVSPNTLDTERLTEYARAAQQDNDSFRARLGISDAPVLLFLGRLLATKRPETAVATIELLVDRNQPATLIFIGDGPERSSLERRARHLPVLFVGALYDDRAIADYLAITDLLLLPGRVGLSCVHGFANGVPCVTTDEDETVQSPEFDYIVNGLNGIVVSSPDPNAYAEEVAALLANRSRLDLLKKGAEDTGQLLTMDNMIEGYVKALKQARQRR